MAIDMNTITDAQLIAEFKERFALPNFFRKKDVEEKHGIITNEQWENFKEDYNDSSMVWKEASENFANDVEFMFDSNHDYESESDEDETQQCCCDICMEVFHEDDLSCLCFNEKCGLFQQNCCKDCCAKNKCEDCGEDEEEVCPSCNKIINADENPCGPGCPLYDEGLEDEEEVCPEIRCIDCDDDVRTKKTFWGCEVCGLNTCEECCENDDGYVMCAGCVRERNENQ